MRLSFGFFRVSWPADSLRLDVSQRQSLGRWQNKHFLKHQTVVYKCNNTTWGCFYKVELMWRCVASAVKNNRAKKEVSTNCLSCFLKQWAKHPQTFVYLICKMLKDIMYCFQKNSTNVCDVFAWNKKMLFAN